MNYEISNLQTKNIEEKTDRPKSIKPIDIDSSKSSDKQDKLIEKEFLTPKNLNKEDSSNKKENDKDDSNIINAKEKNIVTVDLTNDEKIVFSQLGINPLLKLGKEYLTSNNFVRIKDESNEKEKILDNEKTNAKQVKKISKSKEANNSEINIEENANSKVKSTKKTNENEEVVLLDKNDATEITDEINNARKTRRRSSASIE